MERPNTPIPEHHIPRSHYTTPIKAKVQGAAEYYQAKGLPYNKQDIFRIFKVSKTRGYEILCSNPRRFHNHPYLKETRGRPHIVTDEHRREMDKILKHKSIYSGRGLTWEQLGYKVGLDTCARTIQREMGTLHWSKCIACQRG